MITVFLYYWGSFIIGFAFGVAITMLVIKR